MSKTIKYIYEVSDSSVDVRSWTIESDRQLTEGEVAEIHENAHMDNEGKEQQYSEDKDITVTYNGTEYGDDAQPRLEGNFKR